MLEGRVAPAAVIVRQGVVRGAEVGGGDQDRAGQAPPPLAGAPDLVARAAAEAVVEQGGAQRRGVRAVPLAVEVAVAARAA